MSSFVCHFLGSDSLSTAAKHRRASNSNESSVLGADAAIKKKKYFIDDSSDT